MLHNIKTSLMNIVKSLLPRKILFLGAILLLLGTGLLHAADWDTIDLFVAPKDTWPPVAVTNLTASAGPEEGEVQLSWIAPREDDKYSDSGAVQGYEIVYDTFSISDLGGDPEVWWSAARGYYGINTANNPGETEQSSISPLTPGVTYYFAIKSYDDAIPVANISPVDTTSPQASVQTLSAPYVVSITTDTQAQDGSGYIPVEVSINDANQDGCKIKVEYSVNGASGPWYDTYIVSIDTVTYGTLPDLDNGETYQIGTSTNILTNSGPNTVTLTWDTQNVNNGEQTIRTGHITSVRLRITPYDGSFEGNTVSSSNFEVDNCIDTIMGSLEDSGVRTFNSITLNFGTPSSDSNFTEYRMYYNTTGNVTTSDTPWVDPNLSDVNYNGKSSTTVTGLNNNFNYYFNIWIFDNFGNLEKATEIGPIRIKNPVIQWSSDLTVRTDGGGKIDINNVYVRDVDYDRCLLKVEYSSTSATGPWTNSTIEVGSVVANDNDPAYQDTGGPPDVDNGQDYQIGNGATTKIITNTPMGLNRLDFVWESQSDLSNWSGNIYIRLTLKDEIGDECDTPAVSSSFTVDNFAPSYSSSTYDSSSGELTITFDENIDTSEVIPGNITLQNDQSSPTDSFALTEGATGSDTQDVTFTLTQAHKDTITSWNFNEKKLYIDISTSSVKDLYGNIMNALAQPDEVSRPEPRPDLTSASFNSITRVLTLNFDRDMNANSLTSTSVSGIRLQDTQNGTGNSLILTSQDDISGNTSGKEIKITLTSAHRDTISSWKLSNLYLAIDENTIEDITGHLVNPIPTTSALEIEYIIEVIQPAIVSVSPSENALGVNPATNISITFNKVMNTTSVEQAVSITAIRDKDGKSIDRSISGTTSWNSNTFIIDAPLKHNYTYRAVVSKDAKDVLLNTLGEDKIWYFTTYFDSTETNTILPLQVDIDNFSDGNTRVYISANTLPQDGYIKISMDPVNQPDVARSSSIVNANKKSDGDGDKFTYPLDETIREFNYYNVSGTRIEDTSNSPVIITIPYSDDDNDGIVDGTSPIIREKTLSVWWLYEEHSLWVKLPSSVDTENNRVNAPVNHFSVFTLMGGNDTDISRAYCYPVPFIPNDGDSDTGTYDGGITFTNLSSEAKIEIYTISGELAREMNHDDGGPIYTWDVTNSGGERLGSDVYIWLIENERERKTGKLIIIK